MRLFDFEKSRVLIAISIILIFIIGIFIINFFPWTSLEETKLKPHPKKPLFQEKWEDIGEEANRTHEEIRKYISYLTRSSGKRDPFLSTREMEWKEFISQLGDRPLRLEGIIDMEGRRVAIFGGKGFRVGENVGEYQIVNIGEDNCKLTKGGKSYMVYLQEKGGPR
jgi:hypothetical protein